MNAVLHSLQSWKQVPLDVICVSLYHLTSYFHKEIERALHQCGSWELREEFSFCQREPSLMPSMPKTFGPKEIVNKSRGELFNECGKITSSPERNISTCKSSSESQLSLARNAVEKNLFTLATSGCWIVKGTDGMTPYAVTLFPKESCSCASKSCYHIISCKLMVGQSPCDTLSILI